MGSRDPNCVTFVSDPFADQTKTDMINRPEKLPLDLNDVMYTSERVLKRELRHQRHKSQCCCSSIKTRNAFAKQCCIYYIMRIHNGNILYQLKFISEKSLREAFGSCCLLLKENDCLKLMVCLRYSSITGSCVSGYFKYKRPVLQN